MPAWMLLYEDTAICTLDVPVLNACLTGSMVILLWRKSRRASNRQPLAFMHMDAGRQCPGYD
jgi:hypothetical protein